MIPAEGLPVSLYLTDRDLIDTPFFTDGQMILRTTVTGWPVGERISVNGKRVRGGTRHRTQDGY